MPRKPRITAVPVEQVQPDEGLVVARDVPDEKTDAEQMTEILQEVQQEPKEEPKETVSDAPGEVKPKAKRASRAKPKEEPVKEEPMKEEPAEEAKEEPKEEPKGEDQVGCPDCGKQMSAKTLKYSHGPNCSSKKQKKGDEEFAKTLHAAKQIAHEIGGGTRSKWIRFICNARVVGQSPRSRDRAPHTNTSASRASNPQGHDDEQFNANSFLIFCPLFIYS